MQKRMEEPEYWGEGPPTVGQALLRAKQRYFASAAAGSLSTYDEKVLGEMTLYGLPMLGVRVPVTTTTPPGAAPSAVPARATRGATASGLTATPVSFSFDYVSHTVGTQRLYEELDFVIYHAPSTATDFVAPGIWGPEAISTSISLRFRARVEDNGGEIERVVVLYRRLDQGAPASTGTWSLVELWTDPGTGWARASVPPVDGEIEYFVQAVDAAGNVGLAMGHDRPYRNMVDGQLSFGYLPLVVRDYVHAPDLVVRDLIATTNDLQVVVANEGNAPARESFWVDVYVDPDPLPTAVNQIWPYLADEGLVWGVDLVLQPGEAAVLRVGDASYFPEYSAVSWPLAPGTPVYAQVDSAGDEEYGAVRETDEIRGDPYNNVRGTTVGTGAMVDAGGSDGDRPVSPTNLPPRS